MRPVAHGWTLKSEESEVVVTEELEKTCMASFNKSKSPMHCRLEIPAEHVAAFGERAVDFVDSVAKALRRSDAGMDLVLTVGGDGGSSGRSLKLLVEKSSLPFTETERLLDEAVTQAYEAFEFPDIPLIAAIR